jgi:AraC-like DNA-binding protein
LSARIGDGPVADALVSESLRLLRGQVRTIRIRQLLKYLGLSERQFERRFRRAVGILPHQYLRIVRFQEALRLLRERQFEKMSDLASELNYADQSHFIKEIKEFSGYTPSVLFETVRAAVDLPCALIRASPESRAESRGVEHNPSIRSLHSRQ